MAIAISLRHPGIQRATAAMEKSLWWVMVGLPLWFCGLMAAAFALAGSVAAGAYIGFMFFIGAWHF